MKITYIHQHFKLPSEGGGSRPYQFARRLASDGHEVTMICGGTESLTDEIDGIRIKRLAVPYRNAMSFTERVRSFIRFMASASIVSAKTPADIIYASSTPLTVAVPGIIGKVVQRVPMIFEVRDLWPSVPIELGYLNNPLAIKLARILERIAYNCASSVVALSPGMRDGVLAVNPTKRTIVIPNACDFAMFDKPMEERRAFRSEQGWSDDEVVLAYAGGFGPTYQLEWVIELAAAVRDTKIRFVLIGEGKDSDELRELASKLGLDPSTIFKGMRPKEEVAKFIASADLVLSPLRDAPCLEVNSLNKVFDGLAAGRPILVNHEGWLRDAIVNNNAGWQLDRTIEIAAKQLRDLIADKEALSVAGSNGNRLGKTQFERESLYQNLRDELEMVSRSQ